MKNKIIILTVFACLLLSACSDYLDRKPYTQPNNEDFLKTRENVESYINNLYTSLPAPAQYGIGVRGEEVNSDNILSEKYDMRLNGENNQFSGSDDWNKGYKKLAYGELLFPLLRSFRGGRNGRSAFIERGSVFLPCLLALLSAHTFW